MIPLDYRSNYLSRLPIWKASCVLHIATAMLLQWIQPTLAQTPREAYQQGCDGCHSSERHLRRVPRATIDERRAWIENFMTNHPNERDRLKPLIVDYIVSATSSK
jgi:hypothetical protein